MHARPAAPPALAPASPPDPFTGTWKLNVAASRLPFAPPRSVIVQILASEEEITLTERSVDAGGTPETVTIRARFDGRIYPVGGSARVDGFAIERLDRRTLRATGSKNGEPVFSETIELSDDGAAFREDAETTLSDGSRATATLLYERQ